MRTVDIIEKKRDKKELNRDEIEDLLRGYLTGKVADYQMAAFLMAVYMNGMSKEEIYYFTDEMKNSGEQIEIECKEKFILDKHSTGGVGDKTTIALAPIFSSLGILNIKLSGRGLGHTGGTIDKFESIPGFKFPQNIVELKKCLDISGIGLMGYTGNIVPLDKKIYALRDVTATVPSIPLIATSIMSKKLAVKSNGIILDVKVGEGAFMKDIESAIKLADTMIEIGRYSKREVAAVITNMEEPLGRAVGNGLEVIEAIEMLKGRGESDFIEVVEKIAACGAIMAGKALNIEDGLKKVREEIKSGEPLKKLEKYIEICGGDKKVINDYSILIKGTNIFEFRAEKSGYITKINAEEIGKSAMMLGAGREKKEDMINYGVGIYLEKKSGEFVKEKESLCRIYYSEKSNLTECIKLLQNAYKISDKIYPKKDIILDLRGF
jgi:pyrimidine-nucleoside phosphorylase